MPVCRSQAAPLLSAHAIEGQATGPQKPWPCRKESPAGDAAGAPSLTSGGGGSPDAGSMTEARLRKRYRPVRVRWRARPPQPCRCARARTPTSMGRWRCRAPPRRPEAIPHGGHVLDDARPPPGVARLPDASGELPVAGIRPLPRLASAAPAGGTPARPAERLRRGTSTPRRLKNEHLSEGRRAPARRNRQRRTTPSPIEGSIAEPATLFLHRTGRATASGNAWCGRKRHSHAGEPHCSRDRVLGRRCLRHRHVGVRLRPRELSAPGLSPNAGAIGLPAMGCRKRRERTKAGAVRCSRTRPLVGAHRGARRKSMAAITLLERPRTKSSARRARLFRLSCRPRG